MRNNAYNLKIFKEIVSFLLVKIWNIPFDKS